MDEGKLAEKVLLEIVARGQAIVSKICGLQIPKDFQDVKLQLQLFPDKSESENVNRPPQQRPENFDQVDEEMRRKHFTFLQRFYGLLDGILIYSDRLKRYFSDLNNGFFIQESLTTILASLEGKQFLCESIYYLGIMLTLLDVYVDGKMRECLLIVFRRWSGPKAQLKNFERVCKLFFPFPAANYPFEYFASVELPSVVVSRAIAKLAAEDIYNQLYHFPMPEHKTFALSSQASLIAICLFFSPKSLESDGILMREIVDRHFADNFVISYFMGRLYDLSAIWNSFPAARQSLQNTIDQSFFKDQTRLKFELAVQSYKRIDEILPQMNEEYVLEHVDDLLSLTTNVNSVLAWLLKHEQTEHKKLSQIYSNVSKTFQFNVMDLLFLSAYFEDKLKSTLGLLISEKSARWIKYQQSAVSRMNELSEFFSGDKPLTRVEKNQSLQDWFTKVAAQIQALNETQQLVSGRTLVRLIEAVDEIKDLHQMDVNMHLRTFLADAVTDLRQMVRLLNAKEDILVTLSQVTDFSYAWNLLPHHIPYMQVAIKNEPSYVGKLRATFIKMASGMDIPILRINQNHSDLVQASKFYSDSLVLFVERVLQVIPETMFSTLDEIISVQLYKLRPISARILKTDAKSAIQSEQVQELCRLIEKVSTFTEGYLALQKTLVGIVEVDPKRLLEAGLQNELVTRLTAKCHAIVQFSGNGGGSSSRKSHGEGRFEAVLDALMRYLSGIKCTLEFLQDFLLKFKGLKMWNECWQLIVDCHVLDSMRQLCPQERPPKSYSTRPHNRNTTQKIHQPKIHHIQSSPHWKLPLNFMGRIAEELLTITSSERSIYVMETKSWYDLKSKSLLISPVQMEKLVDCLGLIGTRGLDDLLHSLARKKIRTVYTSLETEFLATDSPQGLKDFLFMIRQKCAPIGTIPKAYDRLYPLVFTTFEKLVTRPGSSFRTLYQDLAFIGQVQLIRDCLQSILYKKFSTDCPADRLLIECLGSGEVSGTTLKNRGGAVVEFIAAQELPPISYTRKTSTWNKKIVSSIPDLFMDSSFNLLAEFIFSIFLSYSKKFVHDDTIDLLLPSPSTGPGKDRCDAYSLVCGLLTLIAQTNTNDSISRSTQRRQQQRELVILQRIVLYIDQYARSHLNGGGRREDLRVLIKQVQIMKEMRREIIQFTSTLALTLQFL